jgi:hypothetical protein
MLAYQVGMCYAIGVRESTELSQPLNTRLFIGEAHV